MSRKRKAEGTLLVADSKRNGAAISISRPEPPKLSAFAAAKARANVNPSKSQVLASPSSGDSNYQESAAPNETSSYDNQSHRPNTTSRVAEIRSDVESNAMKSLLQPSSISRRVVLESDEYWDPAQDHCSDSSSDSIDSALRQNVRTIHRDVQLSTWVPTVENVLSRNSLDEILHLKYGETLCIVGHYHLRPISGIVTIFGSFLATGSARVPVFAPSWAALPVIKCISSEGADVQISSIKNLSERASTLEKFSSLMASQWDIVEGTKRSYALLLDSTELGDYQKVMTMPLEVPSIWQQWINALTDYKRQRRPIVQIAGPAHAGKSTLATLLVNSLLTSPNSPARSMTVALLDLDLNKPIFSPPGHISLVLIRRPLLGPHLTRPASSGPSQIIRTHAIGLNGQKEHRAHYLGAVVDLLNRYHLMFKESSLSPPLIIECPAWYQGSGVDLVVDLTKMLHASHVLCLAQGPTKILHSLQKATKATNIESIPPQPFQNARPPRTGVELRGMQLLSYFHYNGHEGRDPVWGSTPVAHQRPYQVSYSRDRCEFAGVFIFGEVPVMYEGMLSTLLNGSLVSLIVVEDESAFDGRLVLRGEGDNLPYFTAGPKGYTAPFDPSKCRAIGIALVRGIDVRTQRMQIVTPVAAQQIAEVEWKKLVLAFGALESPGWAYTEETCYSEWTKRKGKVGGQAPSDPARAAPWVEVEGAGVDEEGKKGMVAGAMQAWKTRRFQ